MSDQTLTRAVVRSLEIIGEASKKLPNDFKSEYPQIEWRKMAGTRYRLIHDYFGVDWELVWNIIRNELPELKFQLEKIVSDFD